MLVSQAFWVIRFLELTHAHWSSLEQIAVPQAVVGAEQGS